MKYRYAEPLSSLPGSSPVHCLKPPVLRVIKLDFSTICCATGHQHEGGYNGQPRACHAQIQHT